MGKSEKNFAQTLEELEDILQSIEGEEVDIDDLADQVERASELITRCRQKIKRTKTRISEVMGKEERGSLEEE